MKRHLDVNCNAMCNKKIKVDNVPIENNNKLSTSKTLTEAEKKARRAEYQRNYRQRVKERQQQQQENVLLQNNERKAITDAEKRQDGRNINVTIEGSEKNNNNHSSKQRLKQNDKLSLCHFMVGDLGCKLKITRF
jgi:hypothetical protein